LKQGQCVDGLCVPADDVEVEGDSGSGGRDAGMSSSQTEFALTSQNDVVEISDAYTACETANDCMGVGTSCDACCQVGAINASLEETYYEQISVACGITLFPTCDCAFPDRVVTCEQGRCRTRPRTVLGCYSPTGDPEAARHEDAVGCLCDNHDAFVCVSSLAIHCRQAWTSVFAWQVVEDPSCMPLADDACTGERLQTLSGCLAEFRSCQELTSGQFCGTR
jgi:hypothetical protein